MAEKKIKENVKSKVVIFPTTRALRDKLVKKAAQEVIEGTQMGLGAGATYSVNNAATKLLAAALGLEYKHKYTHEDVTSNKVGMSFLFPQYIYDSLKEKAERDGISINEELHRTLEKMTS